mmetsp:Transcript_1259/g.4089  ORF Transcript_1259/g.4089 Transcript_1259/m.4089 type:complete len:253 (+) Transcript_1259:1551-2309(+)
MGPPRGARDPSQAPLPQRHPGPAACRRGRPRCQGTGAGGWCRNSAGRSRRHPRPHRRTAATSPSTRRRAASRPARAFAAPAAMPAQWRCAPCPQPRPQNAARSSCCAVAGRACRRRARRRNAPRSPSTRWTAFRSDEPPRPSRGGARLRAPRREPQGSPGIPTGRWRCASLRHTSRRRARCSTAPRACAHPPAFSRRGPSARALPAARGCRPDPRHLRPCRGSAGGTWHCAWPDRGCRRPRPRRTSARASGP